MVPTDYNTVFNLTDVLTNFGEIYVVWVLVGIITVEKHSHD